MPEAAKRGEDSGVMSRLEESLAQHLDLLAKSDTWPYPPPIREFHPMWCCEHIKRDHGWLVNGLEGRPWCAGCAGSHDYDNQRDWRVDFAWPAERVIVEVEGIRYDKQGGRHQTGSGFAKDVAKYAALELAGWRVIRVSQREITSGVALALIESALKAAVEPLAESRP